MISRQRDGYGGVGANGTNGKITGKLPPDGMSFGIVPNTIINKLGNLVYCSKYIWYISYVYFFMLY